MANRRQQLVLLLNNGAGADPIEYLLRDTFESGSWAAGTRDCDVVGQLTVTDSTAISSISGGKYNFDGGVASNDPGFVSVDSWSRTIGLTALFGNSKEDNRARTGFGTGISGENVAAEIGFTGGITVIGTEVVLNNLKTSLGTLYDLAYVLDTAGGLIYIRPAGTGDFTLRWRSSVGTATPVKVFQSNTGTSVNLKEYDSVSVMQDDNTILVNPDIDESTPTSTTVYAGTSSAIIDMSVTAPGTLADQTECRFRVQDSSNYYTMYFDSAGAFKVDRVISGTPTNLVNVAGVITASGTRQMRAIVNGNDLDFWTASGTTWTKRGSTITSSLLTAYSDVVPVIGSGWSASNLRSDKVFDAAITTLLEAWLAGN